MDFHLRKLAQELPQLFPTIKNSLTTAYACAEQQMSGGMLTDELCSQRMGYYLLTNVDHELRRAFENASFNNVEVYAASNVRRTNYHLEIVTPYAVLMVAKVTSKYAVPRRTYYRQAHLEQGFMPVVFPEYKVLNENSAPLYIITHMYLSRVYTPQQVRIGRISHDQRNWMCNYSIDKLIGLCSTEEVIEKGNEPSIHEEIVAQQDRVKLKRV